MQFMDAVKKKILVYDGSKGYMLLGGQVGVQKLADQYNITDSKKVSELYRAYVKAGSDVIQSNTFGANRLILKEYGLEKRQRDIIEAGIGLAKEAIGAKGYVTAGIGQLRRLFKPLGEMTFNEAYEHFAEQAVLCEKFGADAIHYASFGNIIELKSALLAAKENTRMPVICTINVEKNGKTIMGDDPMCTAATLKSLGADIVGISRSLGSEEVVKLCKKISGVGGILYAKPSAGIPEVSDGRFVFPDNPDTVASYCKQYIDMGVRLIGTSYGTTPEYIARLRSVVDEMVQYDSACTKNVIKDTCTEWLTGSAKSINIKKKFVAYNAAATIGDEPIIDLDEMLEVILKIAEQKFDVLILNIDKTIDQELPIDTFIADIQRYVKRPVIFEGKNTERMDSALRLYGGHAGVITQGNTKIAKLAEKYGCCITDDLESITQINSTYGSVQA